MSGKGFPINPQKRLLMPGSDPADVLMRGEVPTGALQPPFDAITNLPTAADTFVYFSGPGIPALGSVTAAGRALIDDASATAQRTTLGLGNVENTALSTWAGSTNITTLGTVTTGVWSGSTISSAKIGAHASSHNAGGSDALAMDSAAATGSLRTLGTSATSACAGNDSRLSDSRAPSGSAGGDLSGTYPNPAVAKIHETSGPTALTIGAIADGQFLKRVGDTLVSAAVSASPGGADTQIQFNDSGSFGGNAGLVFDKTTGTLTISYADGFAQLGEPSGIPVFTFTGLGTTLISATFAGGNPYFVMGDGDGNYNSTSNTLNDADQTHTLNAGSAQWKLDGANSKTTSNVKHVSAGDLIVDDSGKGLVLKSPNGHYWRATISNLGVLSAWADLGTSMP